MVGAQYIGVIDHGTTGTRFVVFDGQAEPLAEAFTKHLQQVIPPDRVEYDPVDIWTSATDAIQRGLARAGIDADALTALAISNQRQTTVVWDATTGEPVGNAISWQDRRTAHRIADLPPSARETIRDTTGLVPNAYFTASKLEWLLDHAGGGNGAVRRAAETGEVLFGTVDSWFVYKLTGAHLTDVTNAAQTMLFDVEELAWDDSLLELFDVPDAMLPPVRPSSDPSGFGRTDPDGVLGTDIPLTAVLGDQQAALVGQAGFDIGDTKVTYGSGNFLLQNTGERPVWTAGDLLTTIWFQRSGEPPRYALEGPVLTTGTFLEWLEAVGLIDESSRIAESVRGADEPSDVFVIPALGGIGAPVWDPSVRAAIIGLTRHTTAEDILRAAVESIAFETRAVLDAARSTSELPIEEVLVDGGAIYNDDFAQLQAELVDTSLTRPEVSQTTARGAAFAAGLAVGWWDSLADVRDLWRAGRTFHPDERDRTVARPYRNWLEVVDGVRRIHARLD